MALRRFPRTNRVSPSNSDKNTTIDKEFRTTEKFFWITGIIFTRTKSFSSFRVFSVTCLDVVFSLFYVYIAIANFYLAATGSSYSPGHALINAFSSFSSVCVRFVVLAKRRQIRRCVDVISKVVSDELEPEELKPMRKFLFWGCTTAISLPLVQMVLTITTDYRNGGHKKYAFLYMFGLSPPVNSTTWFRFVIIALRIANVLLSQSFPMLTVILCAYVFTRLRNMNEIFLTRLRASIESSYSAKLFNEYTTFYGTITRLVECAEKSLSLISFFLYGHIVSSIFSVTSYLITRPPELRYISGFTYQLVTLISIVTCFMILSIRAASVNESAVEVKNIMHTLPSKQFNFNPNLTATMLQLANNFATEVCMTGWGLFVINRSFILTTAGVVVSYGVILVQLGK